MRILVVDDNRDVVESMALVLLMHGHEIAMAFDGEEAIERAREVQPDAILLDIGLPKLNGYEVARRLRCLPSFRDTPIVACTAYGADADRRKSREAGFSEHLTKPVDPLEVRALIESLAPETNEPKPHLKPTRRGV